MTHYGNRILYSVYLALGDIRNFELIDDAGVTLRQCIQSIHCYQRRHGREPRSIALTPLAYLTLETHFKCNRQYQYLTGKELEIGRVKVKCYYEDCEVSDSVIGYLAYQEKMTKDADAL